MKIAVASNNHTRVSGHIGRCKYFNVYEVEGENITNVETRENTFTHHRQGNHGHEGEGHHHHGQGHGHGHGGHSHQAFVDAFSDCKYMIFQSGGWRMIEDLKANNITPVLTDEPLAEEAVKKLLKGELETKDESECCSH